MNDKIVEEYISKLFEIQRARENQPLTEQELKEIALDTGMTEDDWQAAQEVYADHLERAEGFLKYKSWTDAIQEYEQALRIKPNNTQALASIAYAFKMRWQEQQQRNDKEQALEYARRCLQTSPQNAQSLIIVSELSKQTNHTPQAKSNNAKPKTKSMLMAGGVIMVGCLLLLIWFNSANVTVNTNDTIYEPATQNSEKTVEAPLPTGMQFTPSDKAKLEITETGSVFKKLFGNRTSHHVTCSFKNLGQAPLHRLKIEVTWFDKNGVRIIQRDFNVIRSEDNALATRATKNYTIKQSFPQGKDQSIYQYYSIKITKAR